MSQSPQSLRIVFAGTPDFAAEHLKALLASRHQVIAVYTQPDRPAGRGKKLTPSPVKEVALAAGLPVFQPVNFKAEEDRSVLAALNADVMVVVAYGLILPRAVLDIPKYGCINVHASLLPRWRGAAPIQRAIEAGDAETGVTIIQMDVGLDTGDMLIIAKCPILATDNAQILHDRLLELGAPALLDALEQIATHSLKSIPQDESLSCYASKLTKEEALLDWRLPVELLERRVRAFNPFPVAFTYISPKMGDNSDQSTPQEDARVRVWAASVGDSSQLYASEQIGKILKIEERGLWVACAQGAIILENVQLAGKKSMNVGEILRGHPDLFRVGDAFVVPESQVGFAEVKA